MPNTRFEALYRVVTPMFCGGADPKGAPELRAPSFKGVLRFWWRARAWSRLAGDLGKIHDEEECIFGGPGTGASRVRIWIEPPAATLRAYKVGEVLNWPNAVVGPGARYLGYGLMEAFASGKKGTKEGQLQRTCFGAPFEFTVRLDCRGLDAAQLAELGEALKATGLLGGLGARARRGWGSIALLSLKQDGEEVWSNPSTLSALRSAIEGSLGIKPRREGLPEYTAFCAESRFVTIERGEVAEALDYVGREMVRYRSWGRDGRILGGEDSERNFQDDHTLYERMKQSAGQIAVHPRRIAFGLPHNYGQYGQAKDLRVGPAGGFDRRASPLFIHIHRCGSKHVAVIAFLPAKFLPDDVKINVGGALVSPLPEADLWKPILAFLERPGIRGPHA